MSEKPHGPSADAHGKSPDKGHAKSPDAQKAAAEKVTGDVKAVHDATHAAVAAHGNATKEPSGGFFEQWTQNIAAPWKRDSLPRPPNLSTVAKGVGTVAAVALPTVVLPAAGALFLGRKAWRTMKNIPPFRWIDRGVRAGASVAKEGARSLGRVASYPFRLAGRFGLNTLRSGKALILDPLREIINDVEAAINTRYFQDSKEHINVISSALFGIKALALKLGVEMPTYVFKEFWNHPIRTSLVAGGITGLLANAGGDPIVASQMLVNGIGQLFGVLTGSAPAVGVAAGGSSWLPSWLKL